MLLAILLAVVIPAECRQLVVVTTPGWDAPAGRLRRYARAAGAWHAVGQRWDVSLGRAGVAWGRGLHPIGLAGPVKREGDGRSPAGVFLLGAATGYAEQAATRLSYRQATPTLRCVDDPASSRYNRVVEEAETPKDWASAEEMRRGDELYRLTVWVAHNDTPPVKGAGSCIFLHLRTQAGAVTVGCTALDPGPMQELVGWLDPAARPVLVQLPEAVYRERAAAWGLPRP